MYDVWVRYSTCKLLMLILLLCSQLRPFADPAERRQVQLLQPLVGRV